MSRSPKGPAIHITRPSSPGCSTRAAEFLRLYYSTFDDRLPRRYVEEHEKIIEAIRSGDVEEADRLSIAHADQIVRQIQDYVARNIVAAAELPIL